MRILSLLLLMTICSANTAESNASVFQDNPVVTYIDKYKEIAQSEMQRVGIPASIKLAQGILESNSGRSTLAQKANNHFGIKCGKYWEGPTFHREDDDYINGKLIKSCFRKFNNAEHSYSAHSDFLTNPGSQYRYGFLFELDPYDYVSWAHGLKSAGYATDPKYADKIITVIEKYKLYLYDAIAPTATTPPEIVASDDKHEETDNDIPTLQQPKKKRERRVSTTLDAEITEIIHTFTHGETMESVARRYNMDVDLLYFNNRMPNGTQPKIGEKLTIDGVINWFERKPRIQKTMKSSEESYLFEDGSMKVTVQ